MTTKTPATPLPWSAKDRHANYAGTVLMHAIEHGTRRVDDKEGAFKQADAAYIVHAANKYPELVAFVRGVAAENRHAIGADAAALLRSLGED